MLSAHIVVCVSMHDIVVGGMLVCNPVSLTST